MLNTAHTSHGIFPLHIAASDGDIKMMSALLDAGAAPNVTDNLGVSPLVIAARQVLRGGGAANRGVVRVVERPCMHLSSVAMTL